MSGVFQDKDIGVFQFPSSMISKRIVNFWYQDTTLTHCVYLSHSHILELKVFF
jgi:hypothetical protein